MPTGDQEPVNVNPQLLGGLPMGAIKGVRKPQHVELAQAGLPRDLVDALKEAAKNEHGYMVAVWALDAPPSADPPQFRVMRSWAGNVSGLFLKFAGLLLQDIIKAEVMGATDALPLDDIPTPTQEPALNEQS